MKDWNCNLCKEYQSGIACTYCDDGSEFVKMSKADQIRAMSDEELAEWISGTVHYWDDGESIINMNGTNIGDSKEDLLEWLRSEV